MRLCIAAIHTNTEWYVSIAMILCWIEIDKPGVYTNATVRRARKFNVNTVFSFRNLKCEHEIVIVVDTRSQTTFIDIKLHWPVDH